MKKNRGFLIQVRSDMSLNYQQQARVVDDASARARIIQFRSWKNLVRIAPHRYRIHLVDPIYLNGGYRFVLLERIGSSWTPLERQPDAWFPNEVGHP